MQRLFLHCLCVSPHKHRFMERWGNPDYLSYLPQVPGFGSDTVSKVLAQNKQRSWSCTQNAGQHQFPIASAYGIFSG